VIKALIHRFYEASKSPDGLIWLDCASIGRELLAAIFEEDEEIQG
jgi:hypothetical protein